MPLKGLTWARFKEHLRKTSPIYVIGIIVCLLLSNIFYTTTRPQVPFEKEVLIYLVSPYSDPTPLDDLAAQAQAVMQEQDETLEWVHFESLVFNDPMEDYNSAMLLMTRMSGGDADIYLTNESGLAQMLTSGVCLALDEYLAEGWLEGIEYEPFTYTDLDYETDPPTEISDPYIAAVKLGAIPALQDMAVIYDELYMVVAGNCTNLETSMETIEYLLTELTEAEDAPAPSSEPEA